jgi:hypothetical protein
LMKSLRVGDIAFLSDGRCSMFDGRYELNTAAGSKLLRLTLQIGHRSSIIGHRWGSDGQRQTAGDTDVM